jgi:hypothetical protein
MSCYEILDVILSFTSIAVVVFLAYEGFGAWKKQQFLIERHNLARDLLKSVHLLRKTIDRVRSPFMSSGEISEGIRKLDENIINGFDIDQKRDLGEINAYYARWEGVAEIGSEFETQKTEAKIVLGINAEELFKDFMKIINDVKMALQFFGMQTNALVYGQPKMFSERDMKKFMKQLIQGYSAVDNEDDEIDKRFDETVRTIEKSLEVFFKLEEKQNIKK